MIFETVYYIMDDDATVINFALEQYIINNNLMNKTFGKFSIFANYRPAYSSILTKLESSHDIFYSIEKWNVKFPSKILKLTRLNHNLPNYKKKPTNWTSEQIQTAITDAIEYENEKYIICKVRLNTVYNTKDKQINLTGIDNLSSSNNAKMFREFISNPENVPMRAIILTHYPGGQYTFCDKNNREVYIPIENLRSITYINRKL